MAKINLMELDEDKQLATLTKYHKNKMKQAFGWGCDQDPYLTTKCVKKRFIVTEKESERLLKLLILRDNKRSPYVELNFI